MSTVKASQVFEYKAEYTPNIVGVASYYNADTTWSVVLDGTAAGTATPSTDNSYIGTGLKVEITDNGGDVTVFNTDEGFTAPKTGTYFFALRLSDTSTPTQQSGLFYTLEVYKNASLYREVEIDTDPSTSPYYNYLGFQNTFVVRLSLTAGDDVTWKHKFQVGSLLANPVFTISGLQVNLYDREFDYLAMYQKPIELQPEFPTEDGNYLLNITDGTPTFTTVNISASATLDFGTIASHDFEDLTINLAGVVDGDTIDLGRPEAAMVDHVSYEPFVSAPGVVTVRCNNYGGGSANPASGVFTVSKKILS